MDSENTDDVEVAFISPDRTIEMGVGVDVRYSVCGESHTHIEQGVDLVSLNKPGAHCLLTLLADHLGYTLTPKNEEG